VAFDDILTGTGSGFRFAAEAFARVVANGDQSAIDRAAAASIDIAATLQALALSARSNGALIDVTGASGATTGVSSQAAKANNEGAAS
jgi:hypothetical protein